MLLPLTVCVVLKRLNDGVHLSISAISCCGITVNSFKDEGITLWGARASGLLVCLLVYWLVVQCGYNIKLLGL